MINPHQSAPRFLSLPTHVVRQTFWRLRVIGVLFALVTCAVGQVDAANEKTESENFDSPISVNTSDGAGAAAADKRDGLLAPESSVITAAALGSPAPALTDDSSSGPKIQPGSPQPGVADKPEVANTTPVSKTLPANSAPHRPANLVLAEKSPSHQSQLDIEKDAWRTTLGVASLLFWLTMPFFPVLVLRSVMDKPDGIAFVHSWELMAYLIGGIGCLAGAELMHASSSITYKGLGLLVILLSMVVLFALFGFQRQLSQSISSTFFMWLVKLTYITLTMLASFLLMFLAVFFAKGAYDNAKRKDYAKAALQLGGAVASAAASKKVISGWGNYINGQCFADVSATFPNQGFWAVIQQGLAGFDDKNAYRKRLAAYTPVHGGAKTLLASTTQGP